jgi:hypothetical protein
MRRAPRRPPARYTTSTPKSRRICAPPALDLARVPDDARLGLDRRHDERDVWLGQRVDTQSKSSLHPTCEAKNPSDS